MPLIFSKRRLLLVLLVVTLYLTAFSPYLNSWFPAIADYPAGNLLRDLFLTILTAYGMKNGIEVRTPTGSGGGRALVLFLLLFIVLNQAFLIVSVDNISYRILASRPTLLVPLFISALFFLTIQRRLDHEKMYFFISTLATILVFLGVADAITDGEFLAALGYRAEDTIKTGRIVTAIFTYSRATAGIADALNYGYIMSFICVFFCYQYLTRTGKQRVFAGLIALLSFVAVTLSITRGALLAVFIGGGALFLTTPRKVIGAALIVVLTAGALFYTETGQVMLGRLGFAADVDDLVHSQSQDSAELRREQIAEGLDELLRYPMGVGIGTQGTGQDSSLRVVTDNYFLVVLLEIGLLGGMASFFLYVFFLLSSYRIVGDAISKRVFFSFGVMFVICGILSAALLYMTVMLIFWILVFNVVLRCLSNSPFNR